MEDDNSEQETQIKQQLLQREIIDKNLDKGAFINFCLSKRENGDDLNNWTTEELEQVVKEFVTTQNLQGNEQPQEVQQQGGEEEEIKKENLEKMEKFNAEDVKNFKEKTVECRKLEKTALNDKKITVVVKNPKEMAGGLFSLNYILYQVQTDPLEWSVTRRYSD